MTTYCQLNMQEVERSPEDENHKGLSREIVTAQGQLFLWAGFETTANALATLAFMLATRPDLQARPILLYPPIHFLGLNFNQRQSDIH